jgi:Zn-finger nucleic acid-binding protein
MQCPACRLPLATAEISEIEIDFCGACHGTWFDAGEIEALLGRGLPLTPDDVARAQKGERRCPRCRRHLRHLTVTSGLVIDVCADGVWFDRGEVGQLAATLGRSPGMKALGELFKDLHGAIGG